MPRNTSQDLLKSTSDLSISYLDTGAQVRPPAVHRRAKHGPSESLRREAGLRKRCNVASTVLLCVCACVKLVTGYWYSTGSGQDSGLRLSLSRQQQADGGPNSIKVTMSRLTSR